MQSLPGAILFTVPGIAPWIALYGIMQRIQWSLIASVAIGGALIGWIAIQIALIGYVSLLQPLHRALGLMIVGVSLHPTTRRALRSP